MDSVLLEDTLDVTVITGLRVVSRLKEDVVCLLELLVVILQWVTTKVLL